MFSIGFIELVMVAIVALLVLGPDKLPGAVRETAAWIRHIRRYASKVREEIEEQMDDLERDAALDELRKGRKLLDDTRRELGQSIGMVGKGEEAAAGDAAATEERKP